MRSFLLIGLLGALLGCKKDADAPAGPTFTPGTKKVTTYDGLQITVEHPDNLQADTSAADKVVLTAPGFPTITISTGPKGNGMGRMGSVGSGGVKSKLMGPEKSWICESGPPGEFKGLIDDICKSLTPKANPRLLKPSCDRLEGFGEPAVMGALQARDKAFISCFEAALKNDPKSPGFSMSFTLSKQGDTNSRAFSSSVPKADEACVKEAFEGLAADPVFTASQGTASCNLTFAAY